MVLSSLRRMAQTRTHKATEEKDVPLEILSREYQDGKLEQIHSVGSHEVLRGYSIVVQQYSCSIQVNQAHPSLPPDLSFAARGAISRSSISLSPSHYFLSDLIGNALSRSPSQSLSRVLLSPGLASCPNWQGNICQNRTIFEVAVCVCVCCVCCAVCACVRVV